MLNLKIKANVGRARPTNRLLLFPMQNRTERGLVVRVTGGEVRVVVGTATVSCQLRGRLRQKSRDTVVVAGDWVQVAMPERPGDSPALEAVEERTSWLSRYIQREVRERVIVANVERLFVVAATKDPPLHPGFIDRLLVSAERGRVRPCVIINKIDLVSAGEVGEVASMYRACGYDVMTTSAVTGDGVEEVIETLGRGIYAFAGESGVGKSSLLMRIDPRIDIKVREIGEKTGRGRHTTTNSQIYPFRDGYLADTPGVQTFGYAGEDSGELSACFPEFSDRPECHFNPCTHSHEPRCGIKEAVAAGDIAASRYESYLSILAEVLNRHPGKQR